MRRVRHRDLVGLRFDRLTVVSYAGKAKRGASLWNVLCDCGEARIVYGGNMKAGLTRSCGCLHRECSAQRRTHGATGTTEYRIWSGMRQRCENTRQPSYRHYGARGIRVCERWQDFVAFFEDMGHRPAGMSIDRIDYDRGYSCGKCEDCAARSESANCRWATHEMQGRNRRNNVRISHDGETLVAADWARRLGISRQAVEQRLRRWRNAEAVAFPRGVHHPHVCGACGETGHNRRTCVAQKAA